MADRLCRNGCGAELSFSQNANGGWNVLNADGTPHDCPKKQQSKGNVRSFGRSAGELHDIRREAVLNAAVAFASAKLEAGADVDAKMVLQVAKAFLAFVEEGRPA